MMRIGLMSDTHSFFDKKLVNLFKECDEVWHAGDIGNPSLLDDMANSFKKYRAVWGNIDGAEVRRSLSLNERFTCSGLDVWITHIGGYPGRYSKRVREILAEDPPGLFICGHSHILKVIYDKKYQLLHMNPGACGIQGFHHMRTALRFAIDKGEVKDLEVIELGVRGQK